MVQGATIAQWIRLRLLSTPSMLIPFIDCFTVSVILKEIRTKIKQQEAGFGPYLMGIDEKCRQITLFFALTVKSDQMLDKFVLIIDYSVEKKQQSIKITSPVFKCCGHKFRLIKMIENCILKSSHSGKKSVQEGQIFCWELSQSRT